MKLFCGRRWVGHQLCPTGMWWCCWWQRQELPSSAAVVDGRGWNAALGALRLPFLTTRNTFSPRKTVTLCLADSSALNQSSFSSHSKEEKLDFKRQLFLWNTHFCTWHGQNPEEMKNRAVGNCRVKKTLRWEGTSSVQGKCDFPSWPTVGKGWGGHIWVHPLPLPPGQPSLWGLTAISETALHLQWGNTLMSWKYIPKNPSSEQPFDKMCL